MRVKEILNSGSSSFLLHIFHLEQKDSNSMVSGMSLGDKKRKSLSARARNSILFFWTKANQMISKETLCNCELLGQVIMGWTRHQNQMVLSPIKMLFFQSFHFTLSLLCFQLHTVDVVFFSPVNVERQIGIVLLIFTRHCIINNYVLISYDFTRWLGLYNIITYLANLILAYHVVQTYNITFI